MSVCTCCCSSTLHKVFWQLLFNWYLQLIHVGLISLSARRGSTLVRPEKHMLLGAWKTFNALSLLNQSDPDIKTLTEEHKGTQCFSAVFLFLVFFYRLDILFFRGALVFRTAEWEDSRSAGLPVPCCFPLQGTRDASAWWLCPLRHGYWLIGKQNCFCGFNILK